MSAIYEPSQMTLLSTSSRSSVDRAPASVREVMGSIPVGDSDFFFVSFVCHVDQFTFFVTVRQYNFL